MFKCIMVALLTISMSGCRASTSQTMKVERIMFKQQEDFKGYHFGKYIIKNETDSSREVIGTHLYLDDNKYCYLENDSNELYVLNLQNSEVMNGNNFEQIPLKQKYLINDISTGLLNVYDSETNNIIFSYNLPRNDLETTWSNTSKYLIFQHKEDYKTIFDFIVDISNKKVIDMPIKGGLTFLKWAPNDSGVIIDNTIKETEIYFWDINNNQVDHIGDNFPLGLNWVNNSKNIYYIDENTVQIYDYTIKKWKTVYQAQSSDIYSMRWISDTEFVYIKEDKGYMFIAPTKTYAIKVNIENNSEYVIFLNTETLREWILSYDNNYLFYIDVNGLFKAKIDFRDVN